MRVPPAQGLRLMLRSFGPTATLKTYENARRKLKSANRHHDGVSLVFRLSSVGSLFSTEQATETRAPSLLLPQGAK